MIITTDSFTRCWRRADRAVPAAGGGIIANALKFLARCGAVALAASLLWTGPAYGANEGISVTSAKLELADDGWQLSADFDIQFTATLQEAVNRGVPLYFIIEFEVTQPRWYWLDRKNVRAVRERRVAFAPLTQQYRLAVGNYSQNVATFEEVKRQLSSVRGWTVTGRDSLRPGERYEAALRMRLDTSQLPKPFQISAVTSREWTLSSDWHRWEVAGQ